MGQKKIRGKLVSGILIAMILAMGAVGSVMANMEVNTFIKKNIYTGMPQGYISLIDPTDNRLELRVTELNLSWPLRGVDVGWVKDNVHRDPRTYTIEADYVQKVVSIDRGLDEYYVGPADDITKEYHIDELEVNLRDNPYNKLFIIIHLENGERMVDEVDYGDCMAGWERYKGCRASAYLGTAYYNNIVYELVDLPRRVEDEGVGNENGGGEANGGEETVEDEEETGEDEREEVIKTVYYEDLDIEEEERDEERQGEIRVREMSDVREVEESEEETMEIEEGSGETTLDVPILGGGECKNEDNWLLAFLLGLILGGILAWFLTFSLGKYFKRRQSSL